MQDSKYPWEKLRDGTQVWLRQGWPWNVEAGLGGILKIESWSHIMPNCKKCFFLGEGRAGKGQGSLPRPQKLEYLGLSGGLTREPG